MLASLAATCRILQQIIIVAPARHKAFKGSLIMQELMRAYSYPAHYDDPEFDACASALDISDLDESMDTISPAFKTFVRASISKRAATLHGARTPMQHHFFMDPYALLITCALVPASALL